MALVKKTYRDGETIIYAADMNAMQDEIIANGTSIGQLNTNKQAKITTSGILKGNGSGGVSSAAAGTDYLAPSALQPYRTAAAQDVIDNAQNEQISDLEQDLSEFAALKGSANGLASLDANAKVPMAQLPLTDEISNAAKEWLDENVSGGETIAIDKSLTIEGAAADAKAVGDLKSAFITDTEAITGNTPLVFIKGRYSTDAVPAVGRTVTYHDSDDYMCAICPCEPGDVFNGHVYGYTGVDRAYFFCDSEMKIVGNGWAGTHYEWNGKLIAPANSAFVAFSNRLSRLPDGYYVVKGKLLKDIVDSMILEPNGADQTQAIMSKLGTDGCCQLGKGDFYVSNIIMPAGSKLSGCGDASKLHFIDGASGNMVTMGDRCTVSDVSFYGAEYVDEQGNPISIETAKSTVTVSPDFPGSQIENESAVNLWTGGTVTLNTGLKGFVLDTPIEPGTYRVSVTLVRDDESSTAGRIRFSKNASTAIGTSDVIAQADFNKNDRKSVTITVTQTIRAIQFISIIGSTTAPSEWENLRITIIDANKSGIYWAGTDVHYGNVHNCRFFYFNIAGIRMQDTGTPTDRNLYVSDCFFFKNNVGVYIRKNSEYNKFSNCAFNYNYYGSLNRGGNNYFSNCGFDSNYVGYQIDSYEGTNGGHGAITNCSLNHSMPSNTGYGLIIDHEEQMLINNCVIAHSNVLLKSATGCILSSCMFIGNIEITINKGNSNMLIGNYFQGSNTIMRAIDNDKTKAINCYYMVSGSAVPLVTETT